MAFIVILEKGNEEIKENLKLYDDKEMAIQHCRDVEEALDIVNKSIDDIDDEWRVYFVEMEVIYK